MQCLLGGFNDQSARIATAKSGLSGFPPWRSLPQVQGVRR
jgi:hypothetical protein